MADEENLLEEWNHTLRHNNIPNVVLVLIYMFVGSAGNALVIYIYIVAMKTKIENRFFIPYLAVVDILSLLFNGSLEIVFDFYPVTFDSDIGCKFIRFFGNVLVILSGILLTMIAIQRYILVCKAFSQKLDMLKKKMLLVGITVFTLAISAPKFVFTGSMDIDTVHANVSGIVCGIKENFEGTIPLRVYNYILVATAVISVTALAVLYILLVRAIRKRNTNLQKLKNSQRKVSMSTTDGVSASGNDDTISGTTLQSSSNCNLNATHTTPLKKLKKLMTNTRFSWMFFTITVVGIVTYAPRMALENMEAMDKNFKLNLSLSMRAFYGFLEAFYLVNSVVNPFVYGVFDQEFREHTKRLLTKI